MDTFLDVKWNNQMLFADCNIKYFSKIAMCGVQEGRDKGDSICYPYTASVFG